ncbi:MAG: hypothetical protein ACRC5A_16530 [Enterobacteriaceae bacterium]
MTQAGNRTEGEYQYDLTLFIKPQLRAALYMFNKTIYLTVILCLLPAISNAETQSTTSTLSFTVTAVKEAPTLTTVTPTTESQTNLQKDVLAPGLRLMPMRAPQQHDESSTEQHVRIVWDSAN